MIGVQAAFHLTKAACTLFTPTSL
jgi:hypothetical protein